MIIAIYTGYSPYFTNDNYKDPEISKNIGGSEYAVIYLSQEFAKLGHQVYVANSHIVGTRENPGIVKCNSSKGCEVGETSVGNGSVTYCSFNEFNKLCIHNQVDMLIISRYINAFMHCFIRAKKVYLWLHDVIIHDAYQGTRLASNAGPFAMNMRGIDGISAQTEWHYGTLKEIYPDVLSNLSLKFSSKLFLAPNGVDQEIIDASLDSSVKKIPRTFIYASHHSRGLAPLMKIWPFIVSMYTSLQESTPQETSPSTPHLYIYGEKIPETDALIKLNADISQTITVHDKTSHLSLFKKMQECEFWIYPTSFPETFCMLALEAQLAGCKCICSDSGALKNTVGKYGVIMKPESTVNDWVNAVLNYPSEGGECEAIKHARKQSWKERALMWIRKYNDDAGMHDENIGIQRVLSENIEVEPKEPSDFS
jgi:glycosyltransferase involved in cell wall biosynthesis